MRLFTYQCNDTDTRLAPPIRFNRNLFNLVQYSCVAHTTDLFIVFEQNSTDLVLEISLFNQYPLHVRRNQNPLVTN